MWFNRRNLVVVFFILVLAATWYLWDSPERAIRALLRDGEQAVESEDMARAMVHVSRKYLDENGLNYLAVRRVLDFGFSRFEAIDVRLRDVRIDIEDGSASARGMLQVLVAQQANNAYLIGEPGSPDSITITLVKGALGWRITSVNGIDVSRFEL